MEANGRKNIHKNLRICCFEKNYNIQSDCRPWCRKTKQCFKGKTIQFGYVNHDPASEEEEQVMKEMNKYGNNRISPFAVIDYFVTGYDPER